MKREAVILFHGVPAGVLLESDSGYEFTYLSEYCTGYPDRPISLSLPVRQGPYVSRTLFPFFDGLLPEGWLLSVVCEVWKVNRTDRMGLLLACCRDTVGAVSIVPSEEDSFGN